MISKKELIDFLEKLGILIPNPKEFKRNDLGSYIVDVLREQGLSYK